ncbi:hypothetical protein [Flavobacterium cerinum]|uniref:HNH domain-containing protein n=1 Tax=Flavobacterium cerinum TaxID=2502784 RepID=A0ABY5IPE5_9FLAO|nr:hypothetical protein [Flavobacterium cerinum]UUC44713.1 hypothetical protein NOX80_13865 [Flavobacterium cerinum]
MGPIDFSKFKAIKNEYAKAFDYAELFGRITGLEKKYPDFNSFIAIFSSQTVLKNIVMADEKKLPVFKKQFDNCTVQFDNGRCDFVKDKKDCGDCKTCRENKRKKAFHNEIMAILNYKTKGKNAIRKVYPKIGIKTCYICNAQYALSVQPEKKNKKGNSVQKRYSAKFQFDHYFPKEKYPGLSISLYNLLPICSGCNLIKRNQEIGIDFLASDTDKWTNKFTFKIVERTLSSFLLHQKPLEIDFIDNHTYPDGMTKLADRYDIKGIYNTQIDLVEELITRKIKYSETYKDKLSASFSGIFTNTTIEERIILGTYDQEKGIHKRPMSKFLQDINVQLDAYFQQIIKEDKKSPEVI